MRGFLVNTACRTEEELWPSPMETRLAEEIPKAQLLNLGRRPEQTSRMPNPHRLVSHKSKWRR